MNTLSRLHQRVMNAFGIGSAASDATEKSGVQTMQVLVFGAASALKDPVPSLQQFGFASAPKAGARVALVHLAGNPTKGVIIATDDPRYRPAPAPGETILYAATGQTIHLKADGSVHVTPVAGQPTVIDSDLHVTGEVYRGYGGGDQVSLGGHDHAQANDSGGNTEANTAAPTPGT